MQLSHELFLSVWLWMGRHSVKIGDQRTLSTTINSYSKSASLIYIFINLWRGAIETEISLFFRAMNLQKRTTHNSMAKKQSSSIKENMHIWYKGRQTMCKRYRIQNMLKHTRQTNPFSSFCLPTKLAIQLTTEVICSSSNNSHTDSSDKA